MNTGVATSIPALRYRAHRREVDAAIRAVFRSASFILGAQTAAFEQEFASFLGAKHAIGVGSGTDAIELALRALGVGRGDAVLTVAHTAVATVAAIERAEARPVFVDIDPATFAMAPESLERTIRAFRTRRSGPRLKAIVPVHLYGCPCDLPGILSIARAHGLHVVEDCAQAHGASWQGRAVGTSGDAAAFSFYPTKNLGAFGDGGAVVTGDSRVAAKVRMLREYGWRRRYVSSIRGVNSRLDELQAAMLRVALPHLAAENAARAAAAKAYGQLLADTNIVLPHVPSGAAHVFHQFVVRTARRNALQRALGDRGIATQVHYPVPVHRQPAYRRSALMAAGGLPHTDAAAREVLSLPMSPFLKAKHVAAISAAVRAAVPFSS